ncbi:flavin reductase [Colwellia sp. KU-HH00111]
MVHIEQNDLNIMPLRYRAHLVNSLSGFKSANLIGTISNEGQANLAIFSSVVHLGASPALVGFISRPNTTERHTLENIEQTQQYTINQVSDYFWQAAHQTSARYNKNECEFEKTGLSKTYTDGIKAPFVMESQLKYALKLREIVPLSINNTIMVIGEITDIFCVDSAINDDGYIDIESLNTVAISGLDSYHVSQRLSRLSYAKPNQLPTSL